MNYKEITCKVTPREPFGDILMSVLAERGCDSFVDTEDGFLAYIPESDYSASVLENFPLAEQPDQLEFSIVAIPAQNWNAVWEKSFAPIIVNNSCIIKAPFHTIEKKYPYEIIVEPKMSFGTGHHDTTFLMITQLLNMNLKGKKLLDMGCGTGILAILAEQLGADTITAIDIDEWAYQNTKENLITNNSIRVTVHKGDVKILADTKFHVILANINKNILLADLEAYTNAMLPQGELVMSGFFETDIERIHQAASSLGWSLISTQTRNNWALLHLIKN